MRRILIIALAAALCVVVVSSALAADYAVRLKNRAFTPAASPSVAAELRSFAGRHTFVQLRETPNAPERKALAAAGIKLLSPLSGTTWLAFVERRDFSKASSSAVRWVGEILPADKMSPVVREGRFHPHSVYENGRRVIDIGLHADVSEADGRRAIEAAGGKVLEYTRVTNSFLAAMSPDKAHALAAKDEISFVDEPLPALTPSMNIARPAVGGDVANEPPYSVTGSGVSVFVLDGGTIQVGNVVHTDLEGRVTILGFPMPDLIGHPTHVSCTIAGTGAASDGLYQGMAPEAHLLSSTVIPGVRLPPMYNSPSNIEAAYQAAIQHPQFPATVANNSIGSNLAEFGARYCDKEGDYERTAQLADKLVGEAYGRITIVWANGNERGYTACGNSYNTTAPPATAKNIIAVGAVNKEDLTMTIFSSWGPTDDGRLRPDVSAPGCAHDEATQITSCNSPAYQAGKPYTQFCGTSMACPVVTGSVALAQEYWRRQKGGDDARASTFKALFIHGAKDMDDPGPEYNYGYGVINVPDTLDLIDNALIYEESLDNGDAFTLELRGLGGPVKVTLVWTDPAGELMAAKELVNDLDLTAVTDLGTELPWVLDPAHPAISARKGADHVNPVEQAEFGLGQGQPAEVVVTATDVPQGPQVFSLVITGLEAIPATDDDADDDSAAPADDDESAQTDGDDDDSSNASGCGC